MPILAIQWQEPLTLSVLALLILAVLFIWQGWRAMNPPQFFLYLINYLYTRTMWRLTVRGKFPTPKDGLGCLVVANHRSSADPLVLQAALPHPIMWMIAREYCENWMIGWLLRIIGVIPVTRGSVDRTSAKLAIKELRSGSWIGIFPEAKINTTEDLLLPARNGAALLAPRRCAGCSVLHRGLTLQRKRVRCVLHAAEFASTLANRSISINSRNCKSSRRVIGRSRNLDDSATDLRTGDLKASDSPASLESSSEIQPSSETQTSGRQVRDDRLTKATFAIMQAMARLLTAAGFRSQGPRAKKPRSTNRLNDITPYPAMP